jgi:xylulokinase
MQADLFDCEVVTTEGAAEGGAFGAALVAGVGIGTWPSAVEAAKVCRTVTCEVPDPVAGKTLRDAFQVYRGLYSALSPSFAALGAAGLDR